MTCEDFIPFIDAYIDQEFDEREHAEMEVHLSMCDECRERVEFELKLKRELKACLEEKAPDSLRDRIFREIEIQATSAPLPAEAEVARVITMPTPSPEDSESDLGSTQPTRSRGFMRAASILAPLAAAVALVFVLPSFTVAPAKSGQLPVVEQTVDWHVGNYPIEVTGPDAARVTQWFRNKVDFPVRLPQFADRQANLLGGRIAHVQDRRAAYLLYEIDGARMSVLVFNGDGLTIPSDKIRQVEGRDVAVLNNKGYEVAVLQDRGVTYTITSELSEDAFLDVVASSLR